MRYTTTLLNQCRNCIFLKFTKCSDGEIVFGCKRGIDKSDLYNENCCNELLQCPSKFSSNINKTFLEAMP